MERGVPASVEAKRKSFPVLLVLHCTAATARSSAELNPLDKDDALLKRRLRLQVWGKGHDVDKV